ncbi:MAG TPA: GrpB family protein [Pyrinomonadaceae bacterium]|nr:GrpB family protein [Pyrinomonadaceae bacterium]
MKSLEQRIAEALREEVSLEAYNPDWPKLFADEADFLRATLPGTIVRRIEHFGSTAVPGLAAKPVIDLLVEVSSFEETKKEVVPVLEAQGYDYFWRTDVKVPYPWFVKRDPNGKRTHHIHMVKADSKWWDRLYFRDYLRIFDDDARRYEELKRTLVERYPNDRKAYTDGKSEFIVALTKKAKDHFVANRSV